MTRVAVIRLRGEIGLKKPIKKTLQLLRLYNKHTCIIVKTSPNYIGMIEKVRDYVTWGEINQETFKLLLEKRGKITNKQRLTEAYLKQKLKIDLDNFVKEFIEEKKELTDIPGLKPFFKLNPPIKGFERKGIKKPYSMGGALGYRKEAINALIKRMI